MVPNKFTTTVPAGGKSSWIATSLTTNTTAVTARWVNEAGAFGKSTFGCHKQFDAQTCPGTRAFHDKECSPPLIGKLSGASLRSSLCLVSYDLGGCDCPLERCLLIVVLPQVGSLVITSVRKRDSGNYTCSPSNSDEVTVMLHVINGKSVIINLWGTAFSSKWCPGGMESNSVSLLIYPSPDRWILGLGNHFVVQSGEV